MSLQAISIALHILGAILWVGGLYFMVYIVRPVAESNLEPPARQAFMYRTMGRYFVRLWIIVAVILGTGFTMIFGVYGGFGQLPVRIHIMTGIGLLMTLIFAFVHFFLLPSVGEAIKEGDLKKGKKYIHLIRDLARLNMGLGTAIVLVVYMLKFS